jgi:hypothetical protein
VLTNYWWQHERPVQVVGGPQRSEEVIHLVAWSASAVGHAAIGRSRHSEEI